MVVRVSAGAEAKVFFVSLRGPKGPLFHSSTYILIG